MSSRKKKSHQQGNQTSRPVERTPRADVDPKSHRRLAPTFIAAGIATLIVLGLLILALELRRWAVTPSSAPVTPVVDASAEPHANFAGSASCRACHAAEFVKWEQSHHGLAERAVNPKLDAVAFEPERTLKAGTQQTTVRKREGTFEVVANGLSDAGQPAQVTAKPERVIGVSPLRQFLVPAPGGRFQTLEASYDPHKNEWFNVYGDEDRKPGEWGHWTGRGMNWNAMCATCHNTNVRKNYDPANDTYRTSMAEMTVGCESCHGPMKAHVDWQNVHWKGGEWKKDEGGEKEPVVSSQNPVGGAAETATPQDSALRTQDSRPKDPTLKKFSRTQTLSSCGACHARRGELTGAFVAGDSFDDHHWLTIPDHTDLFYPDGQVRDEDYEYTSFLSSKMHAAGVKCVDCHDPHAGKPVLQGNALCMKCHTGTFPNSPIIDPATHSFHQPTSAGALCTSCHMPQTVYMQRHGRHDHGFTIPDPLLTKELKIPNACNRCHTDKDADWAIGHVDKWYGAKMNRPTRDRARLIAKARQGDLTAKAGLLKVLAEDKIPLWRASAAGLLGAHLDDPAVIAALTAATAHAEALVREAAARSLTPFAEGPDSAPMPEPYQQARGVLRRLLDDPSRAVRVRAAWANRERIDLKSQAGKDLLAYLNHNADQPGGAMQMGVWHLARRQLDVAANWLQKAVTWDPNSAPPRDAYAVLLSMQNKPDAAVAQLKEAVRIDPADAELWFKLGLAYAEVRQPDNTIRALETAVARAPRHARALYNLGLAYESAGERGKAIDTLVRAERAAPADPQVPYALATIYRSANRLGEARAAVVRCLQIHPTHAEARQLLQALDGRRPF